jgi:hypothetical protein
MTLMTISAGFNMDGRDFTNSARRLRDAARES